MSERVDIVHWLRDLRHSPAVREIGDVGRGLHLAEAEITSLRAEVERLRMTSDEREVLRLVAQQCAKRHWSDWAIVVDGVLARHGGER